MRSRSLLVARMRSRRRDTLALVRIFLDEKVENWSLRFRNLGIMLWSRQRERKVSEDRSFAIFWRSLEKRRVLLEMSSP